MLCIRTEKLPDFSVKTKISLHLSKILLDMISDTYECHVFPDRYYLIFLLAEELTKIKFHLIETMQTNRIANCKFLRDSLGSLKSEDLEYKSYRPKMTQYH